MQMGQNLDDCLKTLQQGAHSERLAALYTLSSSIVLVPVRRAERGDETAGTKKVRIVSETSAGRKEVPVFSNEDAFSAWANEGFQCLSVAAGDLALTLPPETWLIIDRGTTNEVAVSPDELETLAYPPAPEAVPAAQDASQVPHVQEEPQEAPPESEQTGEEAPDEQPPARPVYQIQEMLEALRVLIERQTKIEEAYYVEPEGVLHGRVLGLLVGPMQSEERFAMIEEIAEVSRKYLGEAGALEVYDDLHSPSSSSWELFNTQPPFFTRGHFWRGDPVLAEDLLGRHSTVPDEPTPDRDALQPSLWQQLRSRARFPFGRRKEDDKQQSPEYHADEDDESSEEKH